MTNQLRNKSIIHALIFHSKYNDGGCLNSLQPDIQNNVLDRPHYNDGAA